MFACGGLKLFKGYKTSMQCIIELVDCISRDGPDTSILYCGMGFNCESGQFANLIIATVDPYRIVVHAHVYVCESINCECRKISQFTYIRS